MGALAGTVRDIQNTVASIQGNASGINDSFATLLPITTMIAYGPPPYGVKTINLNTHIVIGLSQGIQADLGNIMVTLPEIDHHAASICRSILVMGPHCNQPTAPPRRAQAQPPAPRTSHRSWGGAHGRWGQNRGYPVTASDPVEGRAQIGEVSVR